MANGTGIVLTGATNSVIGGTARPANVISGNTYGGMRLESGSSGNVIEEELHRLGRHGNRDPRQQPGRHLDHGHPNNTIGGAIAGAGNVISGNNGPGIEITGEASTGNVVAGNYIGTNAAGTASAGQ